MGKYTVGGQRRDARRISQEQVAEKFGLDAELFEPWPTHHLLRVHPEHFLIWALFLGAFLAIVLQLFF